MPIATLTTDFGLSDYYVGAVKGVLLRQVPGLTVVDISHQVPAGDVATASFLLAAAAPSFPAGTVHLAVIDPGVGSERRLLVVDDGRHRLVAPDNGLLTPWLAPGAAVWAIPDDGRFGAAPSATFDGRDRLAPIAAALLGGALPAALGGLPIGDALRLTTTPAVRHQHRIAGRVAHVDHFGNLVTDIPAGWLPAGVAFRAEVAGHATSRRVDCYAQLEREQAGVLTGSLGTLEFSMPGASLAKHWAVDRGTPITIDLTATGRHHTDSSPPVESP